MIHFQQGTVLQGQRIVRLGQDLFEIFLGQALQLHPYRETPLQFRNQVADLGYMEGTSCNKEHKVRLNRAILGVDRAALHNGQDVTLNAFPADIGTATSATLCDLVDFIDEHDAVLLRTGNGFVLHGIHVDELGRLFLHEQLPGFLHLHMADLGALGHHVAHHVT